MVSSNHITKVLNLSFNGLDAQAIKHLAAALKENKALTSLNLTSNGLCGIDRFTGQGSYTTEGIDAIVEMLTVNKTLQILNLQHNFLHDLTKKMIDDAVLATGRAIQLQM